MKYCGNEKIAPEPVYPLADLTRKESLSMLVEALQYELFNVTESSAGERKNTEIQFGLHVGSDMHFCRISAGGVRVASEAPNWAEALEYALNKLEASPANEVNP